MRRVFIILPELITASVLLVPVFCWLDRRYVHNRRQSLAYYLFSCYLAAVDSVVGLPDITYVRLDVNVNLIPFFRMFSAYQSSLLNVLLFLPMGFFLPVLWRRYGSWWRTVGMGFLFSLAIELLQMLTLRATDVNDLITNTFGTLLGWIAAWILLRLCPGIRPSSDHQQLQMVVAASFAVMLVVHPVVFGLVEAFI